MCGGGGGGGCRPERDKARESWKGDTPSSYSSLYLSTGWCPPLGTPCAHTRSPTTPAGRRTRLGCSCTDPRRCAHTHTHTHTHKRRFRRAATDCRCYLPEVQKCVPAPAALTWCVVVKCCTSEPAIVVVTIVVIVVAWCMVANAAARAPALGEDAARGCALHGAAHAHLGLRRALLRQSNRRRGAGARMKQQLESRAHRFTERLATGRGRGTAQADRRPQVTTGDRIKSPRIAS